MRSEDPTDTKQGDFASVSFITGEVTKDGSSILLRVQTEHDGCVNFRVPTVDLQHIVTLLLLLGGKAALNGRFSASSETFWTRPLPMHGATISVDEDTAVLTIEVGAAVLSFSLTPACMAEIGRTIMTLTAPGQPN
jgi:hypothetical protein